MRRFYLTVCHAPAAARRVASEARLNARLQDWSGSLRMVGAPMAKIHGGRWRFIKSVSEGGQGWVYIVEDTTGEFKGVYALKRLKRQDRAARFRNEVEILRRLNHDHIIKLVDAQVREDGSDDTNYLVMPVAAHGDLNARLSLYTDQLESVVQVVLQIARALKHAHDAGVVHRDIKPGNILFPNVGHEVWVSDFGLSFDLTAEERNTPVDEVVGPRLFIAPELTEYGVHDVKPSADIYSLGQLIFYMLTGGQWVSHLNVLDRRYDAVFYKGERHRLLRLLLGKMIAPLNSRYKDMSVVIGELEQVEIWERNAAGSLLDEVALQSAARLQQRITEELQQKADAEAVRKSEQDLTNTVAISATEWLAQQMEAQKPVLSAGGAIVVDVYVNEPRSRRQLLVDTGSDTLLQEHDIVSLFIRPMTNKGYMVYILHLYVCSEINHKLAFEDPAYLGRPGNPAMAILLMFESRDEVPRRIEIETSDKGYILGEPRKHGVPRAVPITSAPIWHYQITNQHYVDGTVAITRFDAADWPTATSTIIEMLREVLSRVLRYVDTGQ
jgi:serine/threonine protein kinase